MRVLQYQGSPTNGEGQATANAIEHNRAMAGHTNAHGRALRKLLEGWEGYASAHQQRYEGGIGEDYALGPYWAEIGLLIKRLLDGEAGGFDCGSLAHSILAAIDTQGFKHDGYRLESDGDA